MSLTPEDLANLREIVAETEPGETFLLAHEFGAALLAEVERLNERQRVEEASHGDTIDQRDEAQEWADRLAYSIAPMEVIGEHSNGNNPWQNALDAPNPLQARLDKVRALAIALGSEAMDMPFPGPGRKATYEASVRLGQILTGSDQ